MFRLRRPRSPVDAARRVAAGLLVTLALVLSLRPDPAPPPDDDPTVAAVVAGNDLPAGTVLSPEHLAQVRLPRGLVPAGTQPDPGALVGRVLAGSVRAGEPLTDVRLVGPGVTDLLLEGQVAAPVRLTDLAVAALVRTGDHVDVLATAPDAEQAEVVAPAALVLAAPPPAGAVSDPGAGLLLLAVDAPTAARLAAAATTATLTVSFPPP